MITAAVDRDRVAGADQDAVARPDLAGRDRAARPVRLDPLGGLGRDLQQPADGAAGPVQAQGLERLGQPEEEGDRRRLVPLAQPDRPQDRQPHEDVDVEPEPPQASQGTGIEPGPADRDRQDISSPAPAARGWSHRQARPRAQPGRGPGPGPAPARSQPSRPGGRAGTTREAGAAVGRAGRPGEPPSRHARGSAGPVPRGRRAPPRNRPSSGR